MVTQGKKIFIIAGEASGDFIGSKIISALKRLRPNLEFQGVGGQNMELLGVRSIVPMNQLSLMGFIEVIPHIFKIKRFIQNTLKQAIAFKPDVVITIDSPGFNFRVVEDLKNAGLRAKFVHIVAPSVWAYNPERAVKTAELYDLLLTLLPFEPPLFKRYGLDAEFIGHPIFEQNFLRNVSYFRRKYNISSDAEIISVTPGSRVGEIKRHMGVFSRALRLLQTRHNIFVVFPLNNQEDAEIVESYAKGKFPYVCVFDEERLDAYFIADVALAKSGTNTLEISACETPLVVAYKVNFLTYLYVKYKALIKYISLVNILANEEIIPEFIQSQCSAPKLAEAISKYIENDKLSEIQVREASETMKSIGFQDRIKPSARAAEIIFEQFLRD